MDLQTIARGQTSYPISTVKYYPRLVQAIQSALNSMGFSPGRMDGQWGTSTDSAYRNFAQRNGFEAARLSPRAASVLLGSGGTGGEPSVAPSPTPRPAPTPQPSPSTSSVLNVLTLEAIANGRTPVPITTVQQNSDLVRTIQTALRNMGFDVGTVDGSWGSRTTTAYQTWAQRFGFTTTEISPRAASFLLSSGGIVQPSPSPLPIPVPRPTPSPPSPSPSPTPQPPQGNYFPEALRFTLRWEGGYVNNPADYGGATNKGVTQGVYDTYRRRKGLPLRSVMYILDTEVEEIYRNQYWQQSYCDRMVRTLAIVHFDTAVNFGVGGSILFLQETLGVTADGSFGPVTQSALQRANTKTTAQRYVQSRINYRYQRVAQDSSQRVFLQGWLNRDNDLKNYIANLT